MKLCTALAPLALAWTFLFASEAAAFDYIEHLWFTDDACRRVQNLLATELDETPDLAPAYLALAVACPVNWEQPYCEDGDKKARAQLNLLPSPDSSGYPATLGDFSALADHVSRQGPIRNLPRARDRGLVHDMLRWLTDKPGGVGGQIGDVAEDACETRGLDDFVGTERDINRQLTAWWANDAVASVPTMFLGATRRSAVNRGPHDPPMTYSFDNPHYLDLVLRNHHHFGEAAHDAWNGFHSAATQVTAARCEDVIVVDADDAEDLADDLEGFEDVSWGKVPEEELPRRVCAMLGSVVRSRLERWQSVAPEELAKPAAAFISRLGRDLALTDKVVVSLVSLALEGTGLHYLQDGLAGGHMRTIRSREALVEVRHDHDEDNRDGVSARAVTARGATSFVAWGDGYLLGRAPAARCDWSSASPEVLTTCLLAHQRGLIALASVASLIDWAKGGVVYRGLECSGPERAICLGLPMRAPHIAGPISDETVTQLMPGSLPVPPPNFSFESLSVAFGYAPWQQTPVAALRYATFREIGIPAHWLRSWQFRLESGLGEGTQRNLVSELGFGFHYRFYARVMLDLVPTAFIGLRDFGNGADLFAGVSPRIGLSFLPEGWVKIPIELTLFIDQPIVFLATDSAAFSEAGDSRPRALVGFGLAFMH